MSHAGCDCRYEYDLLNVRGNTELTHYSSDYGIILKIIQCPYNNNVSRLDFWCDQSEAKLITQGEGGLGAYFQQKEGGQGGLFSVEKYPIGRECMLDGLVCMVILLHLC